MKKLLVVVSVLIAVFITGCGKKIADGNVSEVNKSASVNATLESVNSTSTNSTK